MTDEYGSNPGRGDDWAAPSAGYGAPSKAGNAPPENKTGLVVMLIVGSLGVIFTSCCILGIFLYEPTSTVQIVNGFDRIVEVTIDDGSTVDVLPQSLVSHTVEPGDRYFSARFVDGTLIEELDFNVPESTDLIVYNIAGMAPAFVESVTYFDVTTPAYTARDEHEEDFEFLAGLRRYTRHNVDYIDRDPPEEIDLPVGRSRAVHWGFFYRVGAGEGDLGPDSTLAILSYLEKQDLFEEVLRRVTRFFPNEDWYHFWLWDVIEGAAFSEPPEHDKAVEWIQFIQEVGRANMAALELHQTYVDSARTLSEVLQIETPPEYYRALHDEMDTVESAFMLASVNPDFDEALELLARVFREGSDHESVVAGAHRIAGVIYVLDEDCERALDHFDESVLIDGEAIYGYIQYYLICLAEFDRVEDARSLVRGYIEDFEVIQFDMAVYDAQLRLSGGEDTGDLYELLELTYRWDPDFRGLTPEQKLIFANQVGMAVSEEDFDPAELTDWQRESLEINRARYKNPERMLALSRQLPQMLGDYYSDMRLLFILLAGIEGDRTYAETVGQLYFELGMDFDSIEAATQGFIFREDAPEIWNRDQRAAYYIGRAHTRTDSAEKRADLEKAMEQNPLWGPFDGIAQAMLDAMP